MTTPAKPLHNRTNPAIPTDCSGCGKARLVLRALLAREDEAATRMEASLSIAERGALAHLLDGVES